MPIANHPPHQTPLNISIHDSCPHLPTPHPPPHPSITISTSVPPPHATPPRYPISAQTSGGGSSLVRLHPHIYLPTYLPTRVVYIHFHPTSSYVSKLRVRTCTAGHPHHPPASALYIHICVHMYISQRTAGKAVVRSGPDTGLYVGGTLGGTLGCGIVAAGGRDREGS